MNDEEFLNCMNVPFNSTEYRLKIPKSAHTGEKYMRKSVNIGDQCSQIIGIFYPTPVDNFVKIVKGQKFYGRYMDDSYVIHRDREFLVQLEIEIAEKAKELGVTPMATWVQGALAGVEPEIMGIGPVAATRKVMERTGLTVDDMDLIEANEAFAAQSVAVAKELGFDMSKVNVNGGAVALGHPVGASGCRILVTLLHEMQKRDAKKGLATLCIGGGMGCATIVERD